MAKKRIPIGPFSGLNLRYAPDIIRDSELCVADNVIIRTDGSVVPRPGFMYHDHGVGLTDVTSGTKRYDLLGCLEGYFLVGVASWDGTKWTTDSIFYWDGASATWTSTGYVGTSGYRLVRLHKYANDIWGICADHRTAAPLGGIKWTAPTAVTNLATYATVATLPRHRMLSAFIAQIHDQYNWSFIWKDRLFMINTVSNPKTGSTTAVGNLVVYSKATDFTDFATTGNYFIVSGETSIASWINDVSLIGDALHIFKNNGIWAFTFQAEPVTDGYLRQISDVRAISTATWNNKVFVQTETSIFELVNNQLIDIAYNLALDSTYDDYGATSKIPLNSLNVIGDFLIVGPSAVTGHYYVCNLLNMAWSKWITAPDFLSFPLSVFVSNPYNTNVFLIEGFSAWGNKILSLDLSDLNDMNSIYDTTYEAAQRLNKRKLPTSAVETKHFKFTDDTQYKKVYALVANIGYQGDLTFTNPVLNTKLVPYSGFIWKFAGDYTDIQPDGDIALSGDSVHYKRAPINVQYGLVPDSKFRCIQFCLRWELGTSGIVDGDLSTLTAYFRINQFFVDVDAKSRISNYSTIN